MKEQDIKRASNDRFFARGRALQRGHAVYDMNILKYDGQETITAKVMGDSGIEYDVDISLKDRGLQDYWCSCPAAGSYGDMCKHGVAVALEYLKRMPQNGQIPLYRQRSEGTTPALKDVLYHYSMEKQARYVQNTVNGQVELIPILIRDVRSWRVEFRIGSEKKYVLKDIAAFVEAMEKKEKVSYGKQLAFIHEKNAFTDEGATFAEFLIQCVQNRKNILALQRSGWTGYATEVSKMRQLSLTPQEFTELLDLMIGKTCIVEDYARHKHRLEIKDETPRLKISLGKKGGGYQLTVPAFESVCGQDAMYLFIDDTAYRCSAEFKDSMEEFCTCGRKEAETCLSISSEDMNVFCTHLYPQLLQHTIFHSSINLEKFMPETCEIYIYLDKTEGRVTCRMESVYGDKKHDLTKALETKDLYRDLAAEGRACATAEAYFPEVDPYSGVFWFDQDQDDRMFQLISTGITQLAEAGEVYVSDALQQVSIKKAPSVGLSIDLSGGLLDVQILSEQMSSKELEELLAAYRLRRKYHRLSNGDFLMLEDSSLETLAELTDGLNISKKELESGHIQVPRYRSFYLDQVLKESGNLRVDRSSAYKALVRNIKSVEDSDFVVPQELKGVLRSYQKDGYRWLMTLDTLGFGGILADDMGLGKSLQLLTFLQARAQEGKRRTSLLICPASLVYNWQEEVDKFVPDLRTLLITGTATERCSLLQGWDSYDLLITSYDLLKRDVEEYETMQFYCEILDEAQNIKNQTTKAAKAVKAIKAQTRFALTGTPIENRLSELWSIFDYLMPGILGSYTSFRKKYETPVVQKNDERIAKRLQRMIQPFLLRRLKGDVLKDLPEKCETVVYSKMEGTQYDLYRANAQKILQDVAGSGAAFHTERIKILAGLTRLRQLCCDPHLLYENYEGASAKLDTCMELMRTALAGGHKILLFSQFTSMLAIIQEKLEQEGVAFHVLTGATSKEKRAELVKSYNNDDVPVFLISLKAGGTGLNLTAATIVIHFDPWWNLAAQNQATDRAHRIGQEQEVTVYKLIARNTIEEKIQKLQEAKARLSDQIITDEAMSLSALSREDFVELLEI